jgi:hypothetical protein
MDALTYIVAFMVAIVAGWAGYFLGNFFPVFGKAKKRKDATKAAGKPMADLTPIKQAGQKALNWLLEREEEEDLQVDAGDEPAENEEQAQPVAPSLPEEAYLQDEELIGLPFYLDEDATILWHNRQTKKIKARIKEDVFDLDDELTPDQHGELSLLLVDLQERIGLSATLRDAIAKETDKVFKDKQRKVNIPGKEEEVKPPSFNPLRSFVNYVQADAPRIEEKPRSIPEQVNEILQKMIEGTALEEKGVSMAEWPNRGAVFIVGIDVYEDIHKIPDPEVRSAIRNAVKAWEETQEDD